MPSRRSLSLASLAVLTAIAAGSAMAQSPLQGQAQTPKIKKPSASIDVRTPIAVTAHREYVKPLITAWDPRDAGHPIRDRDFADLSDLPYCAVAFWTGSGDHYTVVPLGMVELRDKNRVVNDDAVAYTAYDFWAEFECKGGKSCIYDSAEPDERASSFRAPGIAYSRLVYDSGRKQYTGYPSPQAYWDHVLDGMQATAACQNKQVPQRYGGGRG